ncbi:MAG: DNA alkylation repair protein [Actinomycetota bacterium]
MEFPDAMRELKARADPRIATIYARRNPGVDTIGVRFGDLDVLAKRIGTDHELSLRLWDTGIVDARVLAMKIEEPEALTATHVAQMVKQLDYPTVTDLFAHVVFQTRFAVIRCRRWAAAEAEFVRRAGYTLLYDLAADPLQRMSDDELSTFLDRIPREIHGSANWARETMNMAPVAIGLARPRLKRKALAAAKAYGTVHVFHGDRTRCKVWNAVDALQDPRVRIKVPTVSATDRRRTASDR